MNLTRDEILERLARSGRPCSRSKFFRLTRRLAIKPVGTVRSNPCLYSAESFAVIEAAIPARQPPATIVISVAEAMRQAGKASR